ncbi:MAG: hypothetical protein K0U20_09070 [Proteobacteria bacterium]|nr:hypothetical protein [Pseudomonadota bacterium]
MPISATYLQERITATEGLIAAYEAASLAFANNGAMQTYKIDTGQTIQTVTRADLGSITRTIQSLYNQLSTLEARLNGASSLVKPAW